MKQDWLEPKALRFVLESGLMRRRYAVAVLLALHAEGTMGATRLTRELRAHPATIAATLRELRAIGAIDVSARRNDRRGVDIRLSVLGMELAESPPCRWGRTLSKWRMLRARP